MRIFSEKRCVYCNAELDLEKWASHWDDLQPENHHYKCVVCDCGKKSWVKVKFDGSGHDEHFVNNKSSIDSIVKKVRER